MDTNSTTIGTPKPNGGRPVTIEDKQRIFARRELSVQLRGMGLTYTEISKRTGVSWITARDDIEAHLNYCAKYYNSAKYREQIAAIHHATIRERYDILEELRDVHELDATLIKLKALDAIDDTGHKLAKLYRIVDKDTNILIGDVNISAGEGLMGNTPEWAKGMNKETVKELRGKVIAFYKAAHPNAVPAEFQIEEEKEDAAPAEVVVTPEDTGPVSMKQA